MILQYCNLICNVYIVSVYLTIVISPDDSWDILVSYPSGLMPAPTVVRFDLCAW